MDFSLSKQEELIRATARDFAEKEIKPRSVEIDKTAIFPRDIFEKMGKLGFYGMPYPREHGGTGAGYLSYILVAEQIWRVSSGVGCIFAIQTLCSEPVFRFAREEVKQQVLAPMCRGEALGCLCFTEPATGSDPRAITTTVGIEGGYHVLNGAKIFATGASIGDYIILFAMDPEIKRVNAYVVDIASKGFQVEREIETLGLRGVPTTQVFLKDLHVPEGRLLGKRGDGYDILLETISSSKMVFDIGAVGIAQAALDMSITYARERVAYGKPMGNLPTAQWLLAEMASRVEAGRLLTYKTAFLREKGSVRMESAMAKLFNAQMVVQVVDMAMQLHGAYGYTKDMEVERLWRDSKVIGIIEGTSEIQRVIVGSSLLQ